MRAQSGAVATCRRLRALGAIASFGIVLTLTGASGAPTFARMGVDARSTLLQVLYTGDGYWRSCLRTDCARSNRDWGADSLTYALFLRWQTTGDAEVVSVLHALTATAPVYGACAGAHCRQWSDVPEWDAIAAAREYEATGDAAALAHATAAYARETSDAYIGGACPEVHYQRPHRGGGGLKTLETDANAVKAALLIHSATRERRYLEDAVATYAAIRRRFLDPKVPLYTVYLFDDGARCRQVPHRFFASVNGDMISNGLALARATGNTRYRDEAMATASAVDRRMSDGRGVFANLQAENDIAEPLVEAMYELAYVEPLRGAFARAWILRNASAALSARRPDGTYGRFFDGPPPAAPATEWQTSGGLALAFAAAALAPDQSAPAANAWDGARSEAREADTSMLPSSLTFTGSGVALVGTLGERCCEAGHARVLLDGEETFDETGIWQNKSSSGKTLPDSVLFAWRWPAGATHTIELLAGEQNAKEGGPFVHIRRMLVLP